MTLFEIENPKRDIKGRFATKTQAEIDFWKRKYKIANANLEYYKRFCERLKKRINETS